MGSLFHAFVPVGVFLLARLVLLDLLTGLVGLGLTRCIYWKS